MSVRLRYPALPVHTSVGASSHALYPGLHEAPQRTVRRACDLSRACLYWTGFSMIGYLTRLRSVQKLGSLHKAPPPAIFMEIDGGVPWRRLKTWVQAKVQKELFVFHSARGQQGKAGDENGRVIGEPRRWFGVRVRYPWPKVFGKGRRPRGFRTV